MDTHDVLHSERDLIADLVDCNDLMKKTLIQWLSNLKISVLERTTRAISNVEHIAYRNGALLIIKELQDFIKKGFDITKDNTYSDITRQKIEKIKKTLQKGKKV